MVKKGFPATCGALIAAGYERSNYSRCSGCRDAIEWWVTPKKERIPMNPMTDNDSAAVSHFATCPNVDQFRKEPQRATPRDLQLGLFAATVDNAEQKR